MRHVTSALVLAALGLVGAKPARPCSIFTAHDTDRVLVGDNEDWYTEQVNAGYRPMIRFVPAGPGGYGYAMWGFEFAPDQGGMNDQGFFWDGLATPTHTIDASGPEPFTADTMDEMLQQCATVEEALAFGRRHVLTPLLTAQVMVVDRFGDSAIFEGDVTIWPTEDYQVGTNFLQSQPELGGWPCPRYNTLMDRLSSGFELTVGYFQELAEAAHQWRPEVGIYTRYTVIGELGEGVFHLYFDLDWESPKTIVLEEALAEGPRTVYMDELFVPDAAPDAGVADGGLTDAGTHAVDAGSGDPGDGGAGCGGCQASGAGGGWPAGTAWGLILAAVWAWGRRRRRSMVAERTGWLSAHAG